MPICESHALTVLHFRDKGNQRHVACAFDSGGEMSLMLRANAGLTSGTDLPPRGDITPMRVYVFVIDLDVIGAKTANLAPM
jgi:hypothetical protein